MSIVLFTPNIQHRENETNKYTLIMSQEITDLSNVGGDGMEVSSERKSRSTSSKLNYKIDVDEGSIKNDENDDEYKEDVDYMVGTVENNIEKNGYDDDNADVEVQKEIKKTKHTQRGRPHKRKAISYTDGSGTQSLGGASGHRRPRHSHPVDENGEPLSIVNDEYLLPDDPEGETKITPDGDLLGGRQFLVRTFTVIGKGQLKYMLSTEPARAVGFRDSYLFFQYHPNLYKYIISQHERNDLIDRGVLPYSYRNRTIALVTGRSVFKEFGAKIIVDGKNITDDYYSTRLRAEGRIVEGTYAREPSKRNLGRNTGIDVTLTSVNPARNAVEFFDKKNHNINPASNISATNWLYQHGAACSRFNSDLFYDRERILLIENLGLRDSYTNTLHVPQSTQSTKVINYHKVNGSLDGIIYETRIHDADVARRRTGLSEIPLEIFDGVVSEDIKKAILEQQLFENS